MDQTSIGEYAVNQGSKLAPTAAVSGLSLIGVPLQEWVYIVTILYTVLQIGYFVYNIWKRRNGSK